MPTHSPQPLYVFLNEGGDFDFSPTGTRYFTLSALVTQRPFGFEAAMNDLRFDLIESGLDLECFHAAQDRQAVRDQVFGILKAALDTFWVESIIVEKEKLGASMQENGRFYPEMLGQLMRHILESTSLADVSDMIVITDRIPVHRKRHVIEKAVKTTLARILPSEIRYRIMHHCSPSCCGLQAADYFNWAVFRHRTSGDSRSLDQVREAVRTQLAFLEESASGG